MNVRFEGFYTLIKKCLFKSCQEIAPDMNLHAMPYDTLSRGYLSFRVIWFVLQWYRVSWPCNRWSVLDAEQYEVRPVGEALSGQDEQLLCQLPLS